MSDTFFLRLQKKLIIKIIATLAFLYFMYFFYHIEVYLVGLKDYNFPTDSLQLRSTLAGDNFFLLYPIVWPFVLLVDRRKTIQKGIALFLILLWELFLLSIFL